MKFKYQLHINEEFYGYFSDLNSLNLYIKYLEDECDIGQSPDDELSYTISRAKHVEPGWYEYGYVDNVLRGAVPSTEHDSIDLGFILADCDDDASFESTNVLVK